ncbi:MAG: inorganic pyrophosphatase [Wohlfahrtiimonas sp.]
MPASSSERLAKLRVVDPVLTELARGYYNGACVGEKIMPVALVDKEGGVIPQFGREAFKVQATKRKIRGKSNRINPGDLDDKKYSLEEYDLEYPVDYREGNDASFDLKAYAASVVKDGLDLTREKQIAALACDPANYSANNKITLSGTSQFTDLKADIPAIFDDAISSVKRIIGRKPNVAIVSANVWKVMKRHPSLLEKLASTSVKSINLTTAAELLDIDEIIVGEAVYADETTEEIIDVWANDVVIAYVPNQRGAFERNVYEPAYGYTLRRKDALKVDLYDEEGGKVDIVRATDISEPFIVGADAGYLIKNAVGGESTGG